MAAELQIAQGLAPATPAAGVNSQYVDSADRRIKSLDDKGVLNILTGTDRLNRIRNSGMRFAQRQAPGTLTSYAASPSRLISADGWGITCEINSVQYIRVDTVAGLEAGITAQYYGTFSKITNTSKFAVSQVIAGHDVMPLRGRTVRFQCKLKASSAKTLKIAVLQNANAATIDVIAGTFISAHGASGVDPTLGTNLAYLAPKAGVTPDNATAGTNAAQCAVTTAWQRFGLVVDVPVNCKNLIVMVWTDTAFAAADSFSMTEATLTDGMEIQDWAPQIYYGELAWIQRFYTKSFFSDTLPATNVGLNLGEWRGVAGKAGAVANAGFIKVDFPVEMLKAPTVVVYNPAAVNALARNITGAADMGATAITGTSVRGFYTNSTGVAATAVGDLIAINFTADAEI